MWPMIVKEFRQLRRDHRTVALLVFMPVVLLTVFGYAASFDVTSVPTAVVGAGAERAAADLPDLLDVRSVSPQAGRDDAERMLRDGEAALAVVAGPSPSVLVDGSQLFVARAATAALSGRADVEVLFNPQLDTSAVLVPALIGLVLVFVGTLATSLGVVRERQAGTMEQLAVMPLGPWDVFAGKIAPYLLIAALDAVLIVLAGRWLFDVPFNGSVAVFTLGAALFLFVTLGVGVLISSVSQNQGQAVQLALMTLLPQVLLSGMIFPIESMAAAVRPIAYVLPLTYFVQVARGVMLRGAGLQALARPLAGLAVLGALAAAAAVLRFRRELLPSARSAAPRPAGAEAT